MKSRNLLQQRCLEPGGVLVGVHTHSKEYRSSNLLTIGVPTEAGYIFLAVDTPKIIVPVTAQRLLARSAYTAFAVLLCLDLQECASSKMIPECAVKHKLVGDPGVTYASAHASTQLHG